MHPFSQAGWRKYQTIDLKYSQRVKDFFVLFCIVIEEWAGSKRHSGSRCWFNSSSPKGGKTLMAFFFLCEKSLPPSMTPGQYLKHTLQTQQHSHGYRAGRRVGEKMASLLSGRGRLNKQHSPAFCLSTHTIWSVCRGSLQKQCLDMPRVTQIFCPLILEWNQVLFISTFVVFLEASKWRHLPLVGHSPFP